VTGLSSHQSARSQSDTWLTPPHVLAALGPFDLDPCASPSPQPWPTAATIWGSGASRHWGKSNAYARYSACP